MAFFSMDRRIINKDSKPWGYADARISAAGWQPDEITNLVLWLDADDASTITLDESNNVEQWDDKSGNNNHLSQSLLDSKPQYVSGILNNKEIVRFDGIDDYLDISTPFSTNFDFSLFMVFLPRVAEQSDYAGWFSSISDDEGESVTDSFQFDSFENRFRFMGDWGDIQLSSNYTTDAVITLLDTDSGDFNLWLNAVQGQSGTGAVTPVFKTIGLGRNRGVKRFVEMDIAEVILYSRPLTMEERQKIEGYLAHKWGLTANLPATHPYKDTAP